MVLAQRGGVGCEEWWFVVTSVAVIVNVGIQSPCLYFVFRIAVAAVVVVIVVAAKDSVLDSALRGGMGCEEWWCVATGVAVTDDVVNPSLRVLVFPWWLWRRRSSKRGR